MKIKIIDNLKTKKLVSPYYNFVFDKKTGFFARWGKTLGDNPEFGLPEIADIEVTTICHGAKGKLCQFCYKGNTSHGKNMSLETFKRLFEKLPKSVTQIAFGADANGTSNPDLLPMMQFCRAQGVIPNITVADITEETAKRLAEVCGAVSVSRYDKDACYNSVASFTGFGLQQCNIHCMLSEETYAEALELLEDVKTDDRLKKLNAVVFLSLKQKGRGENFNVLTKSKFDVLVNKALELGINFGFDSCSCNKFLDTIKDHGEYKRFETVVEPCEALCFSMYCNVDGRFYPCSFIEGEKGWEEGFDMLRVDDFLKDVWFSKKVLEYRAQIIAARKHKKSCFYFDV